VLRLVDYKTPSVRLIAKAAAALALQPDYFPDVREAAVIAAIKADDDLRDRVYDSIDTERLPEAKE
jgi:hypothetical protein